MLRKYCQAAVVLGIVTIVLAVAVGCSGGDENYVFLNVRERASWGPDDRIAVAALGGDGNLYIWRVSERGGGSTLLTDRPDEKGEPAGGRHPVYSPDGSKIAFSGRRIRGGVADETNIIYIMDAMAGDKTAQPVTEPRIAVAGAGEDICPNWTPDGAAILYSSNRPDGNYDIWRVELATKARTEIIADPTGEPTDELWPAANPTGNGQIVYEVRSQDGRTSHIYLRDTDGTDRILVGTPDDGFKDGAPSWAPDGSYIVFHSNRGGDFDIWRVNPDGTGLQQITNSADWDGYPVFEMGVADPADWRICFLRGNEVWTMKADGSDLDRVTRVFR